MDLNDIYKGWSGIYQLFFFVNIFFLLYKPRHSLSSSFLNVYAFVSILHLLLLLLLLRPLFLLFIQAESA